MVEVWLGFVVTLGVVVGHGVVLGVVEGLVVVVVGHGVVDLGVVVVVEGVVVVVVLHSDMCPSGPIVHLGAAADAWLIAGVAQAAELAASCCCMTPAKAGAASPRRVTKRTILERELFTGKKI